MIAFVLIALSTLILFASISVVSGTKFCGAKLSCANDAIVVGQVVDALGYKSLTNSSVIIYHNISESIKNLNCEGGYSCNKIVSVTNYYGNIECDGAESCSDSKMNLFATVYIRCYGANSCRNSKLQTPYNVVEVKVVQTVSLQTIIISQDTVAVIVHQNIMILTVLFQDKDFLHCITA